MRRVPELVPIDRPEASSPTGRRRMVGAIPRTPIATKEELPVVIAANRALIDNYVARYGPRDAPEDFLSDATVHVLLNFDQCRDHPLRALVTWMRRQRRSAHVERDLVLPEPVGEDSVIEQADVLRTVVATLPERDRCIVGLDASGFESAAIAPRVDTSDGNVRVIICRFRKKLNASWSAACKGALPAALIAWWPRPRLQMLGAMRRFVNGAADAKFAQAGFVGIAVVTTLFGGTVPPEGTWSAPRAEWHLAAPRPPDWNPIALGRVPARADGTLAEQANESNHHPVSPPLNTSTRLPLDDLHFIAAVPSPGYAADGIIIAGGTDRACGCWQIFRSGDHGRTWDGGPAPVNGFAELALPSTYPLDPEIFVADGKQLWRAPRFGQPFVPLPGVGGSIALSAEFATGRRDAFVLNSEGIWRESIDGGTRVLQLAAPTRARGGAIVTGTDASDEVVAWVDGPSAAVAPVGASTIPQASVQAGVYTCSDTAVCTFRTPSPLTGQLTLVRSPSAPIDHRIGAVSPSGVALSVDGGHNFAPLTLPTDVRVVLSFAVTMDSVAAIVQTSTGEVHVLEKYDGMAGWTDVTAPPVATEGVLVALPDGTVMDLLSRQGYWCLSAASRVWQAQCA